MLTLRKTDLAIQMLLAALTFICLLFFRSEVLLVCLLIFWALQFISALLNTSGFHYINFGREINNYWKFFIADLLLASSWIYAGEWLPAALIVPVICSRIFLAIYYCIIYKRFIGRFELRKELGAFTKSKI